MLWRSVWKWCVEKFYSCLDYWYQVGRWPIGRRGELVAIRHLRGLGYTIIAWSDRGRLGEIDVVALDGDTIVFVEVKTRQNPRKGNPAETVDLRKQQQLTRVGYAFLHSHDLLEFRARFDVIAILWPVGAQPNLNHYKNAFEPVGGRYVFY